MMSVILLIFGSFIGAYVVNLGWVFISLVCLLIIYNAIVVLRFALRTIYYTAKRFYVRHIKHRLGLGRKNKSAKTEPEADLLCDDEKNDNERSPMRPSSRSSDSSSKSGKKKKKVGTDA